MAVAFFAVWHCCVAVLQNRILILHCAMYTVLPLEFDLLKGSAPDCCCVRSEVNDEPMLFIERICTGAVL